MTHVYPDLEMNGMQIKPEFEPSGAREGWGFGMVSVALLFSGPIGWILLCTDGCGSYKMEGNRQREFGMRSIALFLFGGPVALVLLCVLGCRADPKIV